MSQPRRKESSGPLDLICALDCDLFVRDRCEASGCDGSEVLCWPMEKVLRGHEISFKLLEAVMVKLMLGLVVLGLMVAGVSGCHASGHADDSGVGANISPNH